MSSRALDLKNLSNSVVAAALWSFVMFCIPKNTCSSHSQKNIKFSHTLLLRIFKITEILRAASALRKQGDCDSFVPRVARRSSEIQKNPGSAEKALEKFEASELENEEAMLEKLD